MPLFRKGDDREDDEADEDVRGTLKPGSIRRPHRRRPCRREDEEEETEGAGKGEQAGEDEGEEGRDEGKDKGGGKLCRRRPANQHRNQREECEGDDEGVDEAVEGEDLKDEGEKDCGMRPDFRRGHRPGRRPGRRPGKRYEEKEVDEEEEEQEGEIHVKGGESIQAALDAAQPGTIIVMEAGVYHEALKSRVDGTKELPIILRGPRRGHPAIVKGEDGRASCIEINHNYYILEHFWIDGTIKEECEEHEVRDAYREKCLAIRGTRRQQDIDMENGDTYASSVEGVVVRHMRISNCGGEGILLRYFVTGCKIHHCKIISTGCFDFKFEKGDRGIKNGEGIYIGTSSNQWHKNLTDEEDICRFNKIFNNFIDTHGNECVDVKEGSLQNIIESNYCTGQLDEDSGGIDSRADRTIIRYNKVVGCKGAGVRLGGHKVGGIQYGIHCKVYGNILKDNEFCGVKIMTSPHQICQNDISGKGDNYKLLRGKFAGEFDEGAECPFEVEDNEDIETTAWFQKLKDL